MSSVDELSTSTQNYLKAVWGLSEWSSDPVTPTLLAQRMGLRLSSVSDAVRRLTEQGLLAHAPYGSVELTESGRSHALAMVRRHRLIETFLVVALGYRWDQVHDEAENLEHAVSDFLIERIDELLDHPSRDPHGDPIPSADGVLILPEARRLTAVEAQSRVVVERISDTDPALLQFFEAHGIGVGVALSIEDGPPFSEARGARLDGTGDLLPLGRSATDAIYVSPPPA